MKTVWQGRMVQAAGSTATTVPMAAVCCNACRTCATTNLALARSGRARRGARWPSPNGRPRSRRRTSPRIFPSPLTKASTVHQVRQLSGSRGWTAIRVSPATYGGGGIGSDAQWGCGPSVTRSDPRSDAISSSADAVPARARNPSTDSSHAAGFRSASRERRPRSVSPRPSSTDTAAPPTTSARSARGRTRSALRSHLRQTARRRRWQPARASAARASATTLTGSPPP